MRTVACQWWRWFQAAVASGIVGGRAAGHHQARIGVKSVCSIPKWPKNVLAGKLGEGLLGCLPNDSCTSLLSLGPVLHTVPPVKLLALRTKKVFGWYPS
jgi:hypothetical protein